MRGQDHNATLAQYSYPLSAFCGQHGFGMREGDYGGQCIPNPCPAGSKFPFSCTDELHIGLFKPTRVYSSCVCVSGFRVTVIGSSEPFGRWCPHSQLASCFSWKAPSYLYSPRVQLANVACAVPHLGRMEKCGKCATLTWSYYVKECLGTSSTNCSTRSSLRATVIENAVMGNIAETEASALNRFVLGSGFGVVFARE